jgi:ATP-binding cassette subfamily C protein LapB
MSNIPNKQTKTDDSPPECDATFLQQPLPVNVLKNLFDKLEISVQLGALTQACEQAQTTMESAPPAKRISFIFNALQLKGVQPAQLRWSRFDQRRLPAMLFYGGEWQLVERATEGQLLLTNESGFSQQHSEEELEDGIVLWLRTALKREQSSVFSLKGNIAARLVLREMFKSRRWLKDIIIATVR